MLPQDDTERVGRLLTKMQRVLSHDLPNQIVALQSLLQLLEMEETSRLSDDGRECVGRLRRVARRAAGHVRFLKEMSRLAAARPCLAQVTPAALVREIDGELRQQLSTATVRCRLVGECQPFPADPRRLALACVELVRFLLERFPAGPCTLEVGGRTAADGVALNLKLTLGNGPTGAIGTPRAKPRENAEVALAEEMLALCGGRLLDICDESDCSRFAILLNPSTGHG